MSPRVLKGEKVLKKGEFPCKKQGLFVPLMSYTTMLITSVESLSLEPRLDTAKSLSSSCKIFFHYYLGAFFFFK